MTELAQTLRDRHAAYERRVTEIGQVLAELVQAIRSSGLAISHDYVERFGDSTYWTVSIAGNTQMIDIRTINAAQARIDGNGNPTDEKIELREAISNVLLEKFKWT
jgi:hypothetical protein